MAKVKGIRKLNKAISAQLKPFGVVGAELSDEYAYIRGEGRVAYKLTEGTIEDIWFAEFIKERFNYTTRYTFILSLLHEVGHMKTDDDISDATYDFCAKEKERIDKAMNRAKTEKTCKKLEWQYFNLPDEIMATAWAVNYARKHPQEIEKMWREMHTALVDFYNVNITIFEDESEV